MNIWHWIDRLGESPRLLVELFVLANFAGLTADIYVAHSMNQFAHWEEWIPFYFSLAAPPVLLIGLLSHYRWSRPGVDQTLGALVGVLAVGVGIAGMVLHLESSFFERTTLKSLVYTAPFAAPLAYAGLGLLLLLNRMENARGEMWARWVLLLAWGGFCGNFVLTLADHEQIGFFEGEAWISVFTSAFAVGFVGVAAVMRTARWFLWVCVGVLGAQILVGLLGLYYHVMANLHAPGATLWDKFVYGAPAFAPLLFPNLAVLAAIGFWALSRHAPPRIANRYDGPTGLDVS